MKDALQYIDKWLCENINLSNTEVETLSNAIKLCMDQNVYQYNEEFFKPTDGTSMSNPFCHALLLRTLLWECLKPN